MYNLKARLEAGAIQLSTESHIKQTNSPLKEKFKKRKKKEKENYLYFLFLSI